MAPVLNAPPQQVPLEFQGDPELLEFFSSLIHSLYTVFFACGGQSGLPTLNIMSDHDSGGSAGYNEFTGETGTPENDPGWASCSTVNMTPPDGYILCRVGTRKVYVPYWNGLEEENYMLLEDEGKIELEDSSGFVIGEES
jgi:hypothetical protein